MQTHGGQQTDWHLLICSFAGWRTEQTPASPSGAVPAPVAAAVVGGSMLIIPQNPRQMSQSLWGRWAGTPLLPPLLRCHDAGSSSDLLGITFNSHAFPGTVGRGAAICPACCATERQRKWEVERKRVCLREWHRSGRPRTTTQNIVLVVGHRSWHTQTHN